MPRVEFGVRLPVAGPLASPKAIARVAAEADVREFHTLWVHDFLVWTRFLDRAHVSCGSLETVEEADPPPIFHESLTTLAFVAGLTRQSNIRLGVAVLCLPYRHPVIAARQTANIDVLSGGRLTLGIGVGAPKNRNNQDFEVLGIPRKGRYARTAEYMRAISAIWRDPVTSFDGEYISFDAAEFFPKPLQQPQPPVWLGGSGPTTLGILAELGNGWLPGLLAPEDYPPKIAEIEALANERGRGIDEITVGSEITACIGETREDAAATGGKTLRSMTEGFPLSLDEATNAALFGSPEDVCEKVQEYVSAGVRHFELKFIYHTVDQLVEELELFSKTVMPEFS